jgi:uncharacterized membrane protein
MADDWAGWLDRWAGAGLIDAEAAARIRAFEGQEDRRGSTRLRWPILIALAFGGLMVCGGILLFVAANWDALSPGTRFTLILLLVGSFHAGGALLAERFRAMSETLHAIGTAVLGAGIALSGQVFNLDEHWPGGIMMWALGAGLAWAILRHSAQMALFAILTPAWLVSEWFVTVGPNQFAERNGTIAAGGIVLLALAYLNARGPGDTTRSRQVLAWIGIVGLVLAAPVLAVTSYDRWSWAYQQPVAGTALAIGTAVAFGVPLIVAFLLRDFDAWPNAAAVAWVGALLFMRELAGQVAVYGWWALGSIGLVAWGVRDGRVERINLGALFFAATVLVFYFSRVMDKLGRSASLVGLGLLFLGGGWALERLRRRLIEESKKAS